MASAHHLAAASLCRSQRSPLQRRPPPWQRDPHELQRPREESRRTNANKAANIMDVSRAEVARIMAEYDAHTLVHGHTHRPGVHREAWGDRYVLGAWERCGWYLRQTGGRFALTCMPLPRD